MTVARVRIDLNSDGIRDLLSSEDVYDMLEAKARAVAGAASARGVTVGRADGGKGEEPLPIDVVRGRGRRARYNVVADHPAALRAESKYRVLGGSLDAAR